MQPQKPMTCNKEQTPNCCILLSTAPVCKLPSANIILVSANLLETTKNWSCTALLCKYAAVKLAASLTCKWCLRYKNKHKWYRLKFILLKDYIYYKWRMEQPIPGDWWLPKETKKMLPKTINVVATMTLEKREQKLNQSHDSMHACYFHFSYHKVRKIHTSLK